LHPTGSFILSVLERVRAYTNEPDAAAKFKDDFVLRSIINPCLDEVVSRVTMTENAPVVCRFNVTIAPGTEYYTLPCAREILRLVKYDTYKSVTMDWRPESDEHPWGAGWTLDGNTIRFNPLPVSTETYTLIYLPSSSVSPHYSTGGSCSADGTTFTFAATPTNGILDRRENAYAGSVLRFLPPSGIWQERIIDSYDQATRTATLRRPLSSIPNPRTSLVYEVAAPFFNPSLWDAIACRAAMKLVTMNRGDISGIQREYASAIKSARDTLSNFNSRRINSPRSFTRDSPESDWGYGFFWLQ